MKKALFIMSIISGMALQLKAEVIFADDFESGNLNNWIATAASPLTISNAQNIAPAGGQFSALIDNSADRMYQNIGLEVGGHTVFTFHMYDPGTATISRVYNEVRGYEGAGYNDGALTQLIAIGKYNSVTMPGETYNATKYQARITFPTTLGWFNLDGPGAPDRSEGWHKFTIERLADGTTLNFYVDDILSKSISGASDVSWDSIVLGSALGTQVDNVYMDGISLSTVPVPEPASLAFLALGAAGLIRRRR